MAGYGDKGILEGKWGKPYDDGTAPWEWTGSPKIIEEYMENKGKQPVKYGQCWVFSAVTVTGELYYYLENMLGMVRDSKNSFLFFSLSCLGYSLSIRYQLCICS